MTVSVGDYARVRYLGERILTRSEAAQMLGISYGTARRLDRQLDEMIKPLQMLAATLFLLRHADEFAMQVEQETQRMVSVIDTLTGRA